MLRLISDYNITGVEKPIVHWNYMCAVITERVQRYTNRIMEGATPVVPWIHLIKTLLMRIPPTALNRKGSDRCAYVIGDVVEKIDKYLCPNYQLKIRYNYFVSTKNNIPVQEYIVPCRSNTPLIDLPIGRPFNEWKDVHPIRILYNDTFELCGNFLHMKFEYEVSPPTQIIVAIDTPALVLKYLAYCDQQLAHKEPIYLNGFIREHLIDNLYLDIVNCWIFQMLEAGAIDNNLRDKQIVTYNIICNENNIDRAKLDLNKYWTNLGNRTYQYGDFIHTRWLLRTFPYTTIYEYIKFLQHSITMPLLRQNAYIRFLLEYPILRMIIKLNCLSKSNICVKMNRHLRVKVVRTLNSNIFNACQNPNIVSKLKRELAGLLDLIDANDTEQEDGIDPESQMASTWEY